MPRSWRPPMARMTVPRSAIRYYVKTLLGYELAVEMGTPSPRLKVTAKVAATVKL